MLSLFFCILYLSQISSESVCVTVTMQRVGLVAGTQPAVVKLYDYYRPGIYIKMSRLNNNKLFLKITLSKKKLNRHECIGNFYKYDNCSHKEYHSNVEFEQKAYKYAYA